MTELQLAMLKKIAFDDYNQGNGRFPECAGDTCTYADGIIETPQDKGVFLSLLNEDMVAHKGANVINGHNYNDADVALTTKGYDFLATMYEVGARP